MGLSSGRTTHLCANVQVVSGDMEILICPRKVLYVVRWESLAMSSDTRKAVAARGDCVRSEERRQVLVARGKLFRKRERVRVACRESLHTPCHINIQGINSRSITHSIRAS